MSELFTIENVPEGKCQEASILAKEKYIPCGAPAKFMVIQSDGNRLRMCDTCADHNVNNRGASLDGEYVPPVTDEESAPQGVDFEALVDEEPSDDLLERLAALVYNQLGLEGQIENKEAELKDLNEQLRILSMDQIPGLLDETGLSEIRLADGTKVVVKETMRASTTGQYREPINMWLEKEGHDDIIKDEVTASFGKGEGKLAEAAFDAVKKFSDYVDRKRFVNTGTFKALVRELLEDGESIPLEELGVHIQRQTKLDKPKP